MMTSTGKTRVLALLLLLFAVGAGGYYYFVMASAGLKTRAEKIASATLGAPVTIDRIARDRATGAYLADGVKIKNPAGFTTPHAVIIRQVRLLPQDAAPGLLSFAEVNVTGAEIFLEVQAQGTNLSALRRNVNRAAAAAEFAAPGQPWKSVLRRLEVADARLYPVATLVPAETQVVTLPDIVLRGIGDKEGGVILSESLGQGFEHLLRVASQAAGQAGFFNGMSPDALRAMQEQLGLTKGILETAVDTVRGDINELATGIRGLIDKSQQPAPAPVQPPAATPAP